MESEARPPATTPARGSADESVPLELAKMLAQGCAREAGSFLRFIERNGPAAFDQEQQVPFAFGGYKAKS